MLYGIAVIAVPLTLLGSAVGHLLRPAGLARALGTHRTLPGVLVLPVACAAVGAELLVGGWALARPATGLLLAALLLAGYGLYGAYVVTSRPPVPCGCAGLADTPLTGWTVVRSTSLAVLAALATSVPHPHGTAETSVSFVAGLAIAVLLWILPSSQTEPFNEPMSSEVVS